MVKNLNFFQMLILKSVLGHWMECITPHVFAKYLYWETQEKTPTCPKKGHFGGKFKFLDVFLEFLSNGTWQRPMVICVVFSNPRRFFSAFKIDIQKFSFDIFQNKFWFTSPYQGNKTISNILRVNALQKQSARHSSSYLVYMASAYCAGCRRRSFQIQLHQQAKSTPSLKWPQLLTSDAIFMPFRI